MTGLRLAILQHERETGLGAFAPLLAGAAVRCEYVSTLTGPLPDPDSVDGAIVLGGSLRASDRRLDEARRWIRDAVVRGMPYLGICLGGQLLARALGARTRPASAPEIGLHDIFLTDAGARDPLFAGLPRRLEVFGFHEDCFDLPSRAVPLAGSPRCRFQAFRFGTTAYALQFHPEVRVPDLERWLDSEAYRRLGPGDAVARAALIEALGRAEPHLDRLARRILERWLALVRAADRPGRRSALAA